MIWYALAIFWSAFLLFLVQPMLGKQILPWFGGTPAVWTTCLLFFQVLLLGGYMYAHGLAAWLKPKAQAIVHVTLLALSLWFLPIAADPSYRSLVRSSPTWQILALLVFTIGGPYFLISATGPLLQAWFARAHARSPYRLYALSNVGSLLALLSYPFVVEPRLRLGTQTVSWSWGYAGFILLCLACAVQLVLATRRGGNTAQPDPDAADGEVTRSAAPPWGLRMLWLGLAASASALLLATTNQICQEVAVVPFLWILPLTLYLLSFIICFDSPRWYSRRLFLQILVLSLLASVGVLYVGINAPLVFQIGAYSLALFACAMTCHGELVRSRPSAEHLTLFYLLVASGGAVGGIFVALMAPSLFTGFWEYHIALFACPLLVAAAIWRDPQSELHDGRPNWARAVLLLSIMSLAAALIIHGVYLYSGTGFVAAARNFYGVLRVVEVTDTHTETPVRRLYHGAIWHGIQFTDEDMRRWPTSYYGEKSGVGLAIVRNPERQAGRGLRIGVIGLGTGTVAALGEEGDVVRFYDINPDVIRFAQEYFTYLKDSPAHCDIVPGDARLELEAELARGEEQKFDVLVMDAFSSDAIPMHLLTKECGEIYWKHLKPDGILAVNISNRNVELEGVIKALADEAQKEILICESDDIPSQGVFTASWALVTSNQQFLEDAEMQVGISSLDPEIQPVAWSDDYGSLWQVLKKVDLVDWIRARLSRE